MDSVRAVFPGRGDIQPSNSLYTQFQMREVQASGVSYVPTTAQHVLCGGAVVKGTEAARSILGRQGSCPEESYRARTASPGIKLERSQE